MSECTHNEAGWCVVHSVCLHNSEKVAALRADRDRLAGEGAAIAQAMHHEFDGQESGDLLADFGVFLEHHKQKEQRLTDLEAEAARLRDLAYFKPPSPDGAPGESFEEIAGRYKAEVDRLLAEVDRLRDLINTPQIDNFLGAVRIEAAHQCERWGIDHDAGKTDADWFWLIGYLAGKALHKPPEKRLHHIITTAAACLNWHAYLTGVRTQMRPGINPPEPDAVPPRRTGEGEGNG